MSSPRLFSGPTIPQLEHKAFQLIGSETTIHPENVLYIGPRQIPQKEVRDRWAEHNPPASLWVTTFEDFTADCYEKTTYCGRGTFIDRPLLFRLIELGVEGINTAENPFAARGFPRAGIVYEAEDLYTNLEFSGLLSADAMETRLRSEQLETRAEHIGELAASIENVRETLLQDELANTYQTERMSHIIHMDTELDTIYPAVEAVVISGLSSFNVLEQQLLERISKTWPTIGLLVKQQSTQLPTGVDAAGSRAWKTYTQLGFTEQHQRDTSSTDRQQVVASLYRHPNESPQTAHIVSEDLDLSYLEPTTASVEVRHIARQIRAELEKGTNADQIGVMLSNPTEYTDLVDELFTAYELPYTIQSECVFSDTVLGEAITAVCSLSQKPRSIETVLTLLTNQLVSVSGDDSLIDHHELRRVALRVESTRLETVLEHVNKPVQAEIKSICQTIENLRKARLESLPEQVETVFDQLGISETLANLDAFHTTFSNREAAAKQKLDRVLETIVLTAPLADLDSGNAIDRLERALSPISINQYGPQNDQRVTVCGLAEAHARSFDRVYVLGLTTSQMPSDTESIAFVQPIYESHPDFERQNPLLESRYQLGSLLASEASITLSTPQRSTTGNPYVEADFITELRRIVDVESLMKEKFEAPPGHEEDVQVVIGKKTVHESESTIASFVETATKSGALSSDQRTRINHGMACASARASPQLTPYDGQLSSETVALVHPEATQTPYSASRLETYAACGFKYYMSRVLNIDEPEPIAREPDAKKRGTFIHDVLERYYLRKQSKLGEPIPIGDTFEESEQLLLLIALECLDEQFDDVLSTAFHDRWLTSVFAGLGSTQNNPYYEPPTDTATDVRGLFCRFLEHEFTKINKTTATPTWFEARVGNPHHGGTPIGDGPAAIETPVGTVTVHGLIDRIDTVSGTDPTQVIVRDYKTGNATPSESDALLGTHFQLPLYALMAEQGLERVETVGAAYYQVAPPNSVNSWKGLVTSQEMAAWHDSDDVDVPLLRRSYPHFETHEAFRRFITETTPKRLGQVVAGIENGQFQPTILDSFDAGCRYCEYSHVCDVRSELRHETIRNAIETTKPVYIPPKALDEVPKGAVEVI